MKIRYHALDTLRGFTLLNMIVYHLLWDLVYLYDLPWSWFYSQGAYIWQQSICWTFILLSGFCWQLGSKSGRRGLTVFLAGILVGPRSTWFLCVFSPPSFCSNPVPSRSCTSRGLDLRCLTALVSCSSGCSSRHRYMRAVNSQDHGIGRRTGKSKI